MKLVFTFLFLSILIIGQDLTTKGRISLGGEVSYARTASNGSSTTIIQLSPQASYFIAKQVELGLAFAYTSTKATGYVSSNTGVGPFFVGYLSDNTIKPCIGIGYLYIVNSSKLEYGVFEVKKETNAFTFMAGILFPLNNNIAIQPILQYSFYTGDGIHLGDITQVLFGIGIVSFL